MDPQLLNTLFMFALMGAVFYFLIIRPQNQRMKAHRELIASLKKGDEVVTQGGLIGKISKVTDDEATVQLAEGVKVQVIKATITEVRGRPEPKAANDTDKS